jgi:hypothetical protein
VLEQRLPQLKRNLNLLYEQIGELEAEALTVSGLARIQLKQQMRDRLWPDVRKYEMELTSLMSQELDVATMPTEMVESVTGEILQVTQALSRDTRYPAEMMAALGRIEATLNEPKLPIAGKLKVALPIIPEIVTYEIEGDVESVVRRLFPTFVKVAEWIAAKKP